MAQEAGAVTVNWGIFINTLVSFIIIAFVVFLVIRQMGRLKREKEAPPAEPTTKYCLDCLSTVSIKATPCAFCTSDISS